jgi:hypothetical protein
MKSSGIAASKERNEGGWEPVSAAPIVSLSGELKAFRA